ncbi:MAG TPA: hypothetical protein VMH78_00500 [Thermoplasmata archaeon]|nr:hypothetical protein [Thermoplasmata archaeon]
MLRHEREELEHRVQQLERTNPTYSAAQIERSLAEVVPVAYEAWKAETPVARSRFRAIQRWRRGARGRDAGRGAIHLFPYLWPVGERQRKEVDPVFAPSPVVSAGSWRLFLYNCGPEVVRDVRVFLDGTAVDYAPSILTGRFAEVHWQRLERVKSAALLGEDGGPTRYPLRVEFVIAKGTRQARLDGEIALDPQQGWVHFAGRDGRAREVE